MSEFNRIEIRNTPIGRQAFVRRTRLAVWQVVSLFRSYEGDLQKTADHLSWPRSLALSALTYAEAFPDEIETALAEQAACDFRSLKRMIPQAEEFIFSESEAES